MRHQPNLDSFPTTNTAEANGFTTFESVDWGAEAFDETQIVEHDVHGSMEVVIDTADDEAADGWQPDRGSHYDASAAEIATGYNNRRPLTTWGRRIVVMAAAVGAMFGGAACSAESQDVAPALPTAVVRPVDQLVQDRVIANSLLSGSLLHEANQEEVASYLDGLSPENMEELADVAVPLSRAADMAALARIASRYTPEQTAAELTAGLHDPAAAEPALEVRRVEDTMAEMRADYDVTPSDIEAARAAVADTQPDLHQAALGMIDAFAAEEAFDIARFDDDVAGAEELLPSVQDPTLRALATQAVGAVVEYDIAEDSDTYDEVQDADYALGDASRHAEDNLAAASEAVVGAEAFEDDMRSALEKSRAILDDLLSRQAAGLPIVTPSEVQLGYIENVAADIDFSTVTGGEIAPNDSFIFAERGENGETLADESLRQFAEVYVENGEMHVRLAENSGLTPEAAEAMQESLQSASPLLTEAFSRGLLNNVRFAMGESLNGSYSPSRDINVFLPSGLVSRDALLTVIVHETSHALTMANNQRATEAEQLAINQTCADLRAAVYERFDSSLTLMPERIDALAAELDPQFQPVIAELRRLVVDNDWMSVLETSPEYAGTGYTACNIQGMGGIINDIAGRVGITSEDLPRGERSLGEMLQGNDAFLHLAVEWGRAINNYAVYDLLNEGAQIAGDNINEQSLGHPEDNIAELEASLLTLLFTKQQEMVEAIRSMAPVEQVNALQALDVTVQMARTGANPELSEHLQVLHDQVVTAVNAQ